MLSQTQMAAALAAYPALGAVSPGSRVAIQHAGKPLRASAGEHLFSASDPCLTYPLVFAGAVRVSRTSRDGREIVLYRVAPGDSCILTVSCLLGRADYPADGLVEGDIAGVFLGRELFERLVATEPAFRRFVFGFFAERMAVLMALIDAIAFHRLDQRLAEVLLRDGPVLQATHQSLADELGSVREVVSRLLKDFESRSAVTLDRGRIRVLNEDTLVEIAGPLRD